MSMPIRNNESSDKASVSLITIGGADSSTGAGIQADLLTCASLAKQLDCQIDCQQIITAVTAQTHQQVVAVNPVSIAVLASQWQAVVRAVQATSTTPHVIKIGLLASIEQIHWLAENITALKAQQPCVVVVDPVLSASSGDTLTQQHTIKALIDTLLPITDVLTANWHEAIAFYECLSTTPDQTVCGQTVCEQTICDLLHKQGVQHVVLKGGHRRTSQEQCVDVLSSANACAETTIYRLTQPRIRITQNETANSRDVRGTGCTFATALASIMAIGYPIQDAFVLANAYVHRGIRQRISIGPEASKLHHSEQPVSLAHFAKPNFPATNFTQNLTSRLPNAAFLPCLPYSNKENSSTALSRTESSENYLGLYPVVDSVEWIERLLPLGIKTIQLRMKNATEQQCREAITRANQLCRQFQCRLFVNDHWQLAIEAGCYGVHLGQEDIQQADLAQIQRAGLRLGTSTHGFYELLIALQLQPSYIAIGAIFPTVTKDMTGQIQGINKLAQLQRLLHDSHPNLPVTAIGGINQHNIESVLQTGVKSVAVVTAITQAPDPAFAVKQLQQVIHCFSS